MQQIQIFYPVTPAEIKVHERSRQLVANPAKAGGAGGSGDSSLLIRPLLCSLTTPPPPSSGLSHRKSIEDGPDQAHLFQPACARGACQAGVGVRWCQVRRRPSPGSVGQPQALGSPQAEDPVWVVPVAGVGRGGDRPVYGHHQVASQIVIAHILSVSQVPGSTVRVEG